MPDVTLLRQLQPADIRCEAGELTGDASCFCSIEGGVIDGRLFPDSVEGFCAGDYQACSTWRAAKEVEVRGGDLRRILAAQQAADSRARSGKALRDARLRAAKERLYSDTPEGRRLRALLKVRVPTDG
jgi:hypothetical protein